MDEKYRKHMADQPCWCCGAKDGTVVGAHQQIGSFARGLKQSDEYLMALCAVCHDILDGRTSAPLKDRMMVLAKVTNRLLKREYWTWRGDI